MNITPAQSAVSLSPTAAQKDPASSAVLSGSVRADPEQAKSAVAKVKLQAPEKVDLGFDPEEMRENIQLAIDRLNQQLKANGRDLSFQMDEELNRPIIIVRNIETGEVVRQIPTEEVVRMAHSIEEGKGLLFNESL
jgi:flagellar protein FlaG